MNASPVSRILVQYEDGSFDEIKPLQRGDAPLYSLRRQQPGAQASPGAFTPAAIAALLFKTAMTSGWTAYSSKDKKMAALVGHWSGTD